MSNAPFSPDQNADAGFTAKEPAERASTEASSLAGEAKAAVTDLGDRAKQGVLDAAEHVRGLAEEQKTAGADRF
jgi:hypothetical protein